MGEKFKWLTGMSLAGFVAVFALHGKAFFEAWAALPPLIRAYSGVLPFGLKSFLLAAAISSLSYALAVRNITCKKRSEFYAQMLALTTGLGVALAQQFIDASVPITRATTLSAIWIGLLAGLGSPVVVRGMMAASLKPPQ